MPRTVSTGVVAQRARQLRRAPSNAATFRVLAVGNPSLELPNARDARVARSGPAASRAGDIENLALLAALWNLDDRFAAEFIERFYRELNTGLPAEEELRRAKAAYVNHPQYSHPFYWSSLVIFGDGTPAWVAEPVDPAACPDGPGGGFWGLGARNCGPESTKK